MDELLQRSPDAEQHLQRIVDPELQAEIGEKLLGLGHVELYDVTQTKPGIFGGGEVEYTKIPEAAHSPEQAAHYDRVGQLIAQAAEVISEASGVVEDRKAARADDYYYGSEYDVYRVAQDIAFDRASSALEHKDKRAGTRAFETMLAVSLVSASVGDCDAQVQRAVELGMATDLLETAQGMHGLVSLKTDSGETHVSSIPAVLSGSADLLRVATNTDFDDQLGHPVKLVRTGLPDEDIARREELINGLDYSETTALARLAGDQLGNNDRAASLSIKASQKLAGEGYMRSNDDPKKIAETIEALVEFAAHSAEPGKQRQATEQLDLLRRIRSAGLKPYRVNNPMSGMLDRAMVRLALDGDKEAVIALMSSSSKEVATNTDSPPEIDPELPGGHISPEEREFMDSNLGYAVHEECKGVDAATRSAVYTMFLEVHAEKEAEFRQGLTLAGAAPDIIDTIIAYSSDPDSATSIAPEFWQEYQTITREKGYVSHRGPVYDLIEGEHTNDLADKARAVTTLLHGGLKPSQISDFVVRQLKEVPDPEQRAEYIAELVETVQELNALENSFVHIDSAIRALSRFEHPKDAVRLAKVMYGERAFDNVYRISELFSERYQQQSMISVNGELRSSIEYIAQNCPDDAKKLFDSGFVEHVLKRVSLERVQEMFQLVATEPVLVELREYGINTQLYSTVLEGDTNQQSIDALNQSYFGDDNHPGLKSVVDMFKGDQPSQMMLLSDMIRYGPDAMISRAASIAEVFRDTGLFSLMSEGQPGFGSRDVILERILATSPDEMSVRALEAIQIFGDQDFASVVSLNGFAYGLRGSLLKTVFESDDPATMAKRIGGIFIGGGSLWHTTSQLAEIAVQGSFYCAGATVSSIPVALPLRSTTTYNKESITYVSGQELYDYLEQSYEFSPEAIEAIIANGGQVPIESMTPELQQTLLSAYLYEAITLSRDPESRTNTTLRNQAITGEQLFGAGSLHHFTSAQFVSAVLQNGLLPGEFVAGHMTADSYPFNVDLVEATDEVRGKPSFREKLTALASNGYGDVCIHINRQPGASTFRPGAEYQVGGYGGQHRLIPGGMPATEISAMTLKTTDHLPSIKTALLEAGIFIPLFDGNGEILYGYEQYLTDRIDGNYDATEPEIVDSQFERPDSQSGSNEGAEFTVPSTRAGAPPTQYYCKFAKAENAEHLWSELLADQIYRTVSPALVPDTRPVILEGRLARASRIVQVDNKMVTNEARNAGFILDALVGNWDATYNASNLIMSGGVAMRIDTGNALFFRAQGERKSGDQFGTVVAELERGGDASRLGGGMRQNYPGLTVQEVQDQAEDLRVNLTDQRVDLMVEAIRMTSVDREQIKQTLKARRDYIIGWAAEVVAGERVL